MRKKKTLWLTINSFLFSFLVTVLFLRDLPTIKQREIRFIQNFKRPFGHHSKQSLILTGIVALSLAALT